MAVQIQFRRDTAANWASNNPTPANGEPCLEDDTGYMKIGNGVDAYVDLPYWPAASRDRLEYGALPLAFRYGGTPVSNVAFINLAVRFATDLKNNYVYYSQCYWDLHEIGGQSWTKLRFPTAADLYTFLQTNAEKRPGFPDQYNYDIVGTCYDIINTEVPHLTKLRGVNSFLAALKGSRRYSQNVAALDAGLISWPDFTTWFNDLCNRNVGFPPGTTYTADAEKAIWDARTTKKQTGLPQDGFLISPVNTLRRWVWDFGSSSFGVITPGRSYQHQVAPPGANPKVWCFLDTSTGSSWQWTGTYIEAKGLSMHDTYSGIVLYYIQGVTDPNERAIFVKPLGIDRIGLNWFDDSLYELFVLYQRFDRTPIIRNVNTAASQKSQFNDIVWVEKAQWYPGDNLRLTPKSVGMDRPYVRFFIRDRTTGEISVPSRSYVQGTKNHHDAPLKWQVMRK